MSYAMSQAIWFPAKIDPADDALENASGNCDMNAAGQENNCTGSLFFAALFLVPGSWLFTIYGICIVVGEY